MSACNPSDLDQIIKKVGEIGTAGEVAQVIDLIRNAYGAEDFTIFRLDPVFQRFYPEPQGPAIDEDQSYGRQVLAYRNEISAYPLNYVSVLPDLGGTLDGIPVKLPPEPISNLTSRMLVRTRVSDCGELNAMFNLASSNCGSNRVLAELGRVLPMLLMRLPPLYSRVQRHQLSNRQFQCLCWVAEGKNSEEIARLMGLSKYTINNYILKSLKKIGANSRSHAISILYRMQML